MKLHSSLDPRLHRVRIAASIVAALGCLAAAPAAGLTITAGIQNFSNGQIIDSATFNSVSFGQSAPFNAFIGSDLSSNFSAQWIFAFAAVPVSSASTSLGICDHDSIAPGNQVLAFTMDGFSLGDLLNAAFEAAGGMNGECNVYSFALPVAALPLLADGLALFALSLQPPGWGFQQGNPTIGSTPFNGAGADFATLTIETEPGTVPEPATIALMSGALAAAGLSRRRKVTRQDV